MEDELYSHCLFPNTDAIEIEQEDGRYYEFTHMTWFGVALRISHAQLPVVENIFGRLNFTKHFDILNYFISTMFLYSSSEKKKFIIKFCTKFNRPHRTNIQFNVIYNCIMSNCDLKLFKWMEGENLHDKRLVNEKIFILLDTKKDDISVEEMFRYIMSKYNIADKHHLKILCPQNRKNLLNRLFKEGK